MIRSLAELFVHEGSQGRARGGRLRRARRRVLRRPGRACSTTSRAAGVAHRVLFLDADEQTLITRYKETRRRHPLAPARQRRRRASPPSATLLAPLRERADVVIDTTGLSAAMLRRKLADEMLADARRPGAWRSPS